jgi:hypothetical protein
VKERASGAPSGAPAAARPAREPGATGSAGTSGRGAVERAPGAGAQGDSKSGGAEKQ